MNEYGPSLRSSVYAVFLLLLLLVMYAVSHVRQSLRSYPRRLRRQSSLAFLSAPLIRPVSALVPLQRTSLSPGSRTCPTSPKRPGICTMTATAPGTATSAAAPISGPAWSLEYTALDGPDLLADLEAGTAAIARMESMSGPVQAAIANAGDLSLADAEPVLDVVQGMFEERWAARELVGNIGVQASCAGSVDGTDEAAKKLMGRLSELRARLTAAYEPASLFLVLCAEPVAEAFIGRTKLTRSAAFSVRHARKMRAHKLSLAEESIATGLGVTGHSAWGTLYTDLSAGIRARVAQPDGSVEVMGVAAASALLDSPDEPVRRAAWTAVRDAWRPHDETCAAVLNAITGWRQAMYDRRKFDSFLTDPLHGNRMSAQSLDAMFSALDANAQVGRRALAVMSAALGKQALDLWDFFAPAPKHLAVDGDQEPMLYTFDEGVELIADAVGVVDKEAGDFVRMMRDKKYIEATRGDKKRPGAYCTEFPKSRTPRVYLSDYNGRSQMLLTLAHELGHAFHAHVMADMPLPETNYPMNLAETASIFFETVVGAALLKKAKTTKERFSILWGEAESAATFLLNIPARFRFEEQLNIRRRDGKLSTKEIDDMMVESWQRYYGDSVNELENVGVFSQSKLHFYLTGISFYNFPYSFGYLFALGVYAEYEKAADKSSFSTLYRNLLRDTGRMEAEKVVEKHLGSRIDDAAYWNSAIGIVRKKVDEFESVYKQLS